MSIPTAQNSGVRETDDPVRILGLLYSYGVMQSRLVKRGLAPSSTLAFIGGTANLIHPLTAIFVGRLVRRWGNVTTGTIAVPLVGLGEILASFCTRSVAGLLVTQGVIVGLGCSFRLHGSPLPSQYFKKNRGLATGLIFGGGGLGGAVMSLSMNSLLDRIDVEWTYRVLGLMILVCGLPAARLLKPRNKKMGYAAKVFEWSLFKDRKFVILLILVILSTFPIYVPPFFIPLFASSIGFSSGAGAGLLSGWNLASAFGRIGSGFLADSKLLGPRRTAPLVAMFLTLTLTGLSMLALWTVSSSLSPLIVFVILNGVGAGGYVSLVPTVCGCVFGSSKLATALGFIVTGFTFGNFMGAPVAGFLLDAYGGPGNGIEAYRPAMYYAGSLSLAGAGLAATVGVLIGRERRNR